MKKTNLPAKFLFYLKSGNLKVSTQNNSILTFKAKKNLREIDIIDLPVKLSKKYGVIKKIREGKDLAKTLKKEKTTLDIKHKGKLLLRLGDKAKPKYSKFFTLTRDIEIKDWKGLRQLEDEL